MGKEKGIKQACSIFRNNPKMTFTPREIEEKVGNYVKVSKGIGRKWCQRLKTYGIIRKKGDKYQLKDENKALRFLKGKRDKKHKKKRSTPKVSSKAIRMVEEHLLKLEGTITYPKEIIDLWLSLGILRPPKPNDPAQQVSWECESFKIVLSLKSYRGSFYIYTLDYKDKAEELFGVDFRNQIELLALSKHSGFIAEDMVGFKHGTKELEIEVDSGSREGIVEVELKGGETLTNNAFKNILRKGVDTTIIEQKIFEVLNDMERRQTRELHAINSALNRVVESMDYQSKVTIKGFEKIADSIERGFTTINGQLTALLNALPQQRELPEQPPALPKEDEFKDVA